MFAKIVKSVRYIYKVRTNQSMIVLHFSTHTSLFVPQSTKLVSCSSIQSRVRFLILKDVQAEINQDMFWRVLMGLN